MRKTFDLNCSPIEQYPVVKALTKSDMTTSQLVLPRHSVEEFIVPNMPECLRNRLKEGDGRAHIWVVDDENRREHYLTMVDRDHRYSIISWGHVRVSRELKEGQEIRFGWMAQKLHFILKHKDDDESDVPNEISANNDHDKEKTSGKGIGNKKVVPPAKRIKRVKGESSTKRATYINP